MYNYRKYIFLVSGITFTCCFFWFLNANSTERKYRYNFLTEEFFPEDTIPGKYKKSKKPTSKAKDRRGDPFSNDESDSPLILPNPSNVKKEVEIDTATNQYIIREKVGDIDYRDPSYMTFDEFYNYKKKEMMKQYWQNKNSGGALGPGNNKQNPFSLKIPLPGKAEGPFGPNIADIRPNGLVTLDFGGKFQRVNNPNIPIRQQRSGGFDFEQQITMNVVGKIGDKLKLTANWDTKAQFDFQNNMKLEYTGYEEDIIQKIEAGTVNMPIQSSLISGAQNLFGVKTKLQFGRLSVTSVYSTQRGKAEEIRVQGGAQSKEFEIKGDDYEEYRHFFLSQYFRDQYEKALAATPVVNTDVVITRVDVYVTNRSNNTQTLRDFVAYLDLGEGDPFNNSFQKAGNTAKTPVDNNSNTLYDQVKTFTDLNTINNSLANLGMSKGTDYETVKSARKLLPTEFKFNAKLGYISLNTMIRQDEVLAVAYEYSVGDKTFKVGQTIEDSRSDSALVILKMLKPSTVKTRLPTWDLMMKNIYQLGSTQITRENFQFRVIYKNDFTGADLPALQEGKNTKNVPLLQLMGLDRLNPNNDPIPDGNLDYVEDVTVDSKNGRIIFPVLEPFGDNMKKKFTQDEVALVNKYAYTELYDSTKSDAKQVSTKDKYFLKGRYQSTSSSDIILPGINIAPGSVTVLAGSQTLVEGTDYTVDYNLGRLKIINEGVLNSNKEIRIRFEKQDMFNFRRKTFFGSRFDYKINNDFILGGTLLHQHETPNITRVSLGDEPSSNNIVGIDANFKKDSRTLTKAVDLLPIIQTKAPSTVQFSGEAAKLFLGYPRAIKKNGGTAFIDDFEGAKTPYDLTRSANKWKLAATPKRFVESDCTSLKFAYNRAKLAWYNIDNVFYRQGGNGKPDQITDEELENHFVRAIPPQEVSPNYQNSQNIVLPEVTLDLSYYPTERGQYNFNPDLTPDGHLKNPSGNYGGITREIRNDIDFDNSNIQYIEFWMMSPYIDSTHGNTIIDGKPFNLDNSGFLYFNLGSISEDVIRDSKQEFENGLPVNGDFSKVDPTVWGKVTNQQYLTNSFDNTNGAREKQDVGLDGLSDAEEVTFHQDHFLNKLPSILSTVAHDSIFSDPAADDFNYYLGNKNDDLDLTVLQRYKNYNGMEKNSPVSNQNSYTPANTNVPDNEDLNGDNTLSDLEEYYEYKIPISRESLREANIGNNYIVDVQSQKIKALSTGKEDVVQWYQFRIPIRLPDSIVGNINGFKSIKFMRVYMTGFSTPVVLRLAKLQMVANQWRVYQDNNGLSENALGLIGEPDDAQLTVSTVNIEENGGIDGESVPYVIPPGFTRDYDPTQIQQRQINEQSLRLCVDNLDDRQGRGVYKLMNINLLNYNKFRMFVHAETSDPATKDGDMNAFIRIGTDVTENYYEIKIPLYFTKKPYTNDPLSVWRAENELDLALEDLVNLKVERDRQGKSLIEAFTQLVNGRQISVVGRPDLSAVQVMMLGLKNPGSTDKKEKSACIWVDEMRATDFEVKGGWAAAGKMNVKLADLATIQASGRYSTVGFGSLEQRISERELKNTLEYGIASNITLDKFIPQKLGIKLPMYVSYDRRLVSPQYDPLDPDVEMKKSINKFSPGEERKQYRTLVLDNTVRHAINFTNIQKVKTKKDAKSHLWDIENLSLTVGYSETKRTSILIKDYTQKIYKGGLGYNYSFKGKAIEPFKKLQGKSAWLKPIKDFNFTPLPSNISIRGDLDRRYTKTQYYEGGNPLLERTQPAYFEKQFTFNRTYGMLWNFTKSLSGDYNATTNAIIDEPLGESGSKHYKDSVVSNILKLGRVKEYNQVAGLTYKVPLDKIPVFDWLGADTRYSAGYTWSSGALGQRDTLGNVISNKRDMSLNGRINLEKLYNKSKFLKGINNAPPPKQPVRGKENEKEKGKPNKEIKPDDKAAKKDSTEAPKKDLKALKSFMRALMSVKTINFTYNITQGMVMPGYMPGMKVFGMGDDKNGKFVDISTMLPFILGSQDATFRNRLKDKGYLSTSTSQNQLFTKGRSVTFTARTNLEPIKDFKIQLEASQTQGSDYKDLFKFDPLFDDITSLGGYRTGRYEVTYIAIKSAFKGHDKNSLDPHASEVFSQFERNRYQIRNRLGDPNFGLNSQDVLLPAFLAAYSGKDVNKVKLSPLPGIPLPNWRIDYNGLTRIPAIKNRFPSVIISHSYTSKYAINGYTSSKLYSGGVINPSKDLMDAPRPTLLNDKGEYVPVYVIDQVTLKETFNPLIGVNMKGKNKMTYRVEIRRDRLMTLSLSNAQMTEARKNDLVIGIGYAKTGFQIPKFIKRYGEPFKPLKNELTFKFDVTISDQKTIQRKIEETNTVTNGNLNIQINPTISYIINPRVNLQFYFNRNINQPRISSSYRRATTAFGVQLRFTLS